MIGYAQRESCSFILRGFLPHLALCSLAWELMQLPPCPVRAARRWGAPNVANSG